MPQPRVKRIASVATIMLVTSSLIACTNDTPDSSDTVKVGLMMPRSGVYEEPAADMRDAFELYVEANDGKLGGHDVTIVHGDEGSDAKSGMAAAEKLVKGDDVDVLIGGIATPAYVAGASQASDGKLPFIGVGGKPDLAENDLKPDYLWQTSYDPLHPHQAIAPYLAEQVKGPVYVIGPDYRNDAPQHKAFMESFTKPYKKEGGEMANPDGKIKWIPYPETPPDLSEYFDEIADSDAKAIYTYNGGPPAIEFVKQWSESEASDIPLYGSFITEGSALDAEGKSAQGVRTVMNYSPSIDNAPNRNFISTWNAAYPKRQTSTYHLTGWDSALVLDQAISTLGSDVTGEDINAGLASLGTIDSPRGSWQFSKENHNPVQRWYLREVDFDGPNLTNMVTDNLATLGGD